MNDSIFDRSKFLTTRESFYKEFLENFISWSFSQDLYDKGDITSKLLGNKLGSKVEAQIKSRKDSGIFCGKEELEFFFEKFGIRNFEIRFSDGEEFDKGKTLLEIVSSAEKILKIERVLLNFLQRMISISTNTNKYVETLKKLKSKSKIATTRKNDLGILDKKAVSVGGGLTHRLGLFDAILVKDNHLELMDINDISFEKINTEIAFFEIEVDNAQKVLEIAEKSKSYKGNFILMLDNFGAKEAKETIEKVKKMKLENFFIELSGGINIKNLKDYASAGADFISTSKLTNEFKAIDIGLDFK